MFHSGLSQFLHVYYTLHKGKILLCLDSDILLYGSDGSKENMNFHNRNIDLEVDVKVTEVTKVKF